MALDTRGFMDGALRGFDVAERHYQRQEDNERRQMLDERNEERYQNERARLSDIDERNEERYQKEQDYRQKKDEKEERRYQASQKKQSALQSIQMENQAAQRDVHKWDLAQKKKLGYLTENMPLIQAGAQKFIESGEIDPIFDNEYVKGSAYDPRRYSPRVVQAAYEVESAMPQVLNGSMSYQDPRFTKAVGTLLDRNAKQGIGEKDPQTGKVITDKQYLRHDFVADIDPNREGEQPGVVVGLKVTYDDGSTRNAAVTEGRGAGADQAVKVIPLEDFMKDVTGQITLAKEYFNNDNYAKLFSGSDKKTQSEVAKQWRDAVTELEQDRSEALGNLLDATPEQKDAVNQRFDERRAAIDQVFGKAGGPREGSRLTPAQQWAAQDPQKQQFIAELSQSLDVSNIAPETLEQNYQRAVKMRQDAEGEKKRQEQLAKLRSEKQGGGESDYDRANREYLARSPQWQQNLSSGLRDVFRPPSATSNKEVDYSGYSGTARPF
ncbi:ATPase [Vibrio sp. ABG19]|uniref:ATPase n=1 Tax=Vibrio sp. ABG19 TaxID=2817385 RepID=UPI00249F5DEF|nr:ATPase [Vibrio sp. ABG19]WGY45221.1 ATPase [Vibrio sp. ABG19]